MQKSLWIAASGMEAQQVKTDVTANNMANVNTSGFKKSVAHFQDMLYQKLANPGADTSNSTLPTGTQIGTGVKLASVSKVFTQGALSSSSSDLDIAIEGDGFFQVSLPDGTTAYSRAGNFQMDSTGNVVTGDGYSVLGFPTLDPQSTSITITSEGVVSVYSNGVTSSKGTVQLARFANPEGLEYMGRNLYKETAASGSPTVGTPSTSNFGRLAQHYNESSNVEIIKEMVDMIASQRAYEINSKSVKTADEMLRQAVNLK